jgi:hypothetical protein
MSSILKLTTGLVALLCTASVAAEGVSSIQWEVGTEYYQETYREKVNDAPFMQQEANMLGLYGQVRIPFNAQHAVAISARYAGGQAKYTGAFQGQPYGSLVLNGIDRYTAEVRAMYELSLPWVTPSVGVGYRRLLDRLDQMGPGAYKRTSQYWFLIAGLASTIDLGSSGMQLTPKLTYHHLMRGQQHSDDIGNHQPKGYGAELSLALSGKLTTSVGWQVTPYYRYWNIEDSERTQIPGGWWMEPRNTTKEIGARLSLTF